MQEQNEIHLSFRERHSASIRIWHWLTLIVICGSLTTVLMGSTFFDQRKLTPVVKDELSQSKVTVSDDVAKGVAHEVGEPIWTWHKYIGWALATLFLYRIIIEFFQPKGEGFFHRLKKAFNAPKERGQHYKLVRIVYTLFYSVLTVVVITGLCMSFRQQLGIPKNIGSALREVHEFCMYVVLTYLAAHLTGVVIAELSSSRGVVSDMINGGDKEA